MGKDSAGRPASASAARTSCDLLGEPRGGRRPGAEEPVAPADRAPQRGLAGRAEPQRRVGLLERLGLHRLVLELPELPVEGDPGLRPQRLHQLDALGEPRDVPPRIHAEGGERPARAAGAHADLDPAPAELVQRAQALGQVHRAVQRGHEHHAAQPQPLGAGGRVGHRLDRRELIPRPEQLFLRPRAVEAQLLGPGQVGPERRGIELAVGVELRDGDREPHEPQRIGRVPAACAPGSRQPASGGWQS